MEPFGGPPEMGFLGNGHAGTASSWGLWRRYSIRSGVGAELGRLLADLGAEVIKVENSAYPDGSRQSLTGDSRRTVSASGAESPRGSEGAARPPARSAGPGRVPTAGCRV